MLLIGQGLNTRTIRRQVRHTAERLESAWATASATHSLATAAKLAMGGPNRLSHWSSAWTAFTSTPRGQRSRAEGWFEAIVGKSLSTDDRASKCFGFVSRYDGKPKRRLFEWLKVQRLHESPRVTFLSDGGDTVRELPLRLHPQSEHLLDWFHLSMRLTAMTRMAKGVREAA